MRNKEFFKTPIFFVLASLLLVGLAVLVFFVWQGRSHRLTRLDEAQQLAQVERKRLAEQQVRTQKINEFFESTQFIAESVLVQDILSQDILFQQESSKKQPMASLTKLATALVALQEPSLIQVEIQEEDLYPTGDYFLQAGEVFNKEDLIVFMLSISANDAARAFSNTVSDNPEDFIDRMNELAQELGLSATFFLSDTGLDITNTVGGSYSNAIDISKLMVYFFQQYPDLVTRITQPKPEVCSDRICHVVENTNPLLSEYPEIVFSKTGYTNSAGGNLGVLVKTADRFYSIIVLGSTKEGRFVDVEQIINGLKKIDSLID